MTPVGIPLPSPFPRRCSDRNRISLLILQGLAFDCFETYKNTRESLTLEKVKPDPVEKKKYFQVKMHSSTWSKLKGQYLETKSYKSSYTKYLVSCWFCWFGFKVCMKLEIFMLVLKDHYWPQVATSSPTEPQMFCEHINFSE